jgi:hypothetical protein
MLNFNCALIILPTFRTVLSTLRSLQFGVIVPLDKNIVFHRYIGYMIAISTCGHIVMHYFNYSCCVRIYGETNAWDAAWRNKFGITGHIIIAAMILMYSSASKNYRRSSNFSVFWFTHHLYFVFYCTLLIHAKNFWMVSIF